MAYDMHNILGQEYHLIKKTSIFSGGSRSVAKKVAKAQATPAKVPSVDISEEALQQRREQRKTFPQAPLLFDYTANYRKKSCTKTFDFTELANKHLHLRPLINQLLVGADLILPPGLSRSAMDDTYTGILEFILLLTSKEGLVSSRVECVADIDALVFASFKTFLISVFPRRTTNRKHYGVLKRICESLRKKYSDDPTIGKSVPVPDGPQTTEKPTEGYNVEQLKALAKACLKDIKEIKALHQAYDGITDQTARIDTSTVIARTPDQKTADEQFMAALATLKIRFPTYPYKMSFDEAKGMLARHTKQPATEELQLRNKIIKVGSISSGKISFFNGTLGRGAAYAAMQFVQQTIFPFFLLSAINTGWNKESLTCLSDNLDDHVAEDLLDPKNYVVICSFKNRGESVVTHRCKRNAVFGPYQLLKYVEQVIRRNKDSNHYAQGHIFQFTYAEMGGNRINQLVGTFNDSSALLSLQGIAFVKRHNLESIIGKTIPLHKVRSGYATLLEGRGLTPSQIARDLGHADAENGARTADEYYLSDTSSNVLKDAVISDLQNKYMTDICNFKQRVVESKTLQQLRDAINSARSKAERREAISGMARELSLEEKTIVHLLSPAAQTYILACEGRNNPTWPGNEEFLKGRRCRQFNKCCLCRQAVIFPEALPFISLRIIHLDKMQQVLTGSEWTTNYADEYEAWNYILDRWNNRLQIQNAWEIARSGRIALPKVMKGASQ